MTIRSTLLAAMLMAAAGCTTTPFKSVPPIPLFEPGFEYSKRISLTGNLLEAPPLQVMALAVIPFGTDANAIGLEKQKNGVQFQIMLESCSENGCIIESGDVSRVIIARSGIADAFPLGFIEHGWKRHGLSAISDKGWLAMPVATEDGTRELWIIDQRFRLRKRIPIKILVPILLRWRGEDAFIVHQSVNSTSMEAKRVNLDTGRITSATPIEPWWLDCRDGSASGYSAGWYGENPQGFEGNLVIPLWHRGDKLPMALELTATARPMTGNGLASPQKILVDCEGRICLVTALGEDIWCMRFSPEGVLQNATHMSQGMAGDAKGIQIDRQGRFYYIDTILEKESPERLHLVRLE